MSEKREILFRGKRVDNGEWIEGYFLPGNERQSLHPCIFVYLPETQNFECFDIDIDTLSEYTGLTDKNGLTKIFEGDILSGVYSNSNAVVEMIAGCWVGYAGKGWNALGYLENKIEVIGNIHDNPELLKGD